MSVNHHTLHLKESQLQPASDACPFCSAKGRQKVAVLQDLPPIDLLRCGVCGAVSASRMPLEELLATYYGNYYGPAADHSRITFDGPERMGRHLSNRFSQHHEPTPRPSILDYGGGDGTISHHVALDLLQRGAQQVDITVVDYSPNLVQPADPRIQIRAETSLSSVENKCDLVLASAVIEHILSPREILTALMERMAVGAIFYARTPFRLPIMRLLKRFGIRIDFTYPGHLHDLGQKFWESWFTDLHPGRFDVLHSNPSIVESTVRNRPCLTLAAHLLKAPWHVLGRHYGLVGGWEIFARKTHE